MTTPAHPLPGGVRLRAATADDAAALTAAHTANRDHLAPWEPRRTAEYYTAEAQEARLASQLAEVAAGRMAVWVLEEDGSGKLVGGAVLAHLVLGALRSGSLGYWVAADRQGRGLATAAVRRVCRLAATELGLHRVEASVIPANVRSVRVLRRCGFERIGAAPRYLHIDGAWRDHDLYQLILHDDPPPQG